MTTIQRVGNVIAMAVLIGFVGLMITVVSSCGAVVSYLPDPGAPSCKDVQAHLVEVGCPDSEICNRYVEAIKREFVYQNLPEGVPFDQFCDFVVSKLDPTDCVMEAQNTAGVIKCIEDYAGIK